MKSFMKMVPEIDLKLFRYISLLSVQGGIDAKLKVFDDACRQFKPDLILIDSARDLCRDFNDNREADGLVNHFKQIATDLNAVLITTSHKSLVNGNAKGHFGMRLNEAAGLELSLKKDEDALEKFIKVEFPKRGKMNMSLSVSGWIQRSECLSSMLRQWIIRKSGVNIE